MMLQARSGVRPVQGTLRLPGDKSISHRAAILAALAHGDSRIQSYSTAGDCMAPLAGTPGRFVLSGDGQLLRRPMERIPEPLRAMGARVPTLIAPDGLGGAEEGAP